MDQYVRRDLRRKRADRDPALAPYVNSQGAGECEQMVASRIFHALHVRLMLQTQGMTYRFAVCTMLIGALVAGCGLGASAQTKPIKKKTVMLKNASGSDIGTATILSKGSGVEVKLNVKDLTPGVHAVHFHQNARCDPPDFKSAGGHFNPTGKHHGFDNPEGHHAGDMRNFTVKPNGTAKATVEDTDVVLGTGSESNSLFANGGTAIVIHAKADDYKTDPAGNSGDRVACGVITP